MKKYRGYFLYYVKGRLRQYSFRGATKQHVRDWYAAFGAHDYIGAKIHVDSDKSVFHLGY